MGVLDDLAEASDALAEVTSNVAAAGAKIEEVAKQLNAARSLVIEVDNHLSVSLDRIPARDQFDSGGFGVLPSDAIPPHNADIFGVRSKGGSVGSGAVGSVSYQAPGFTMLVGFNNPAVGNNKANVSLQGPTGVITRFRVSCLVGAGDTEAHARYQINRHAPYSIGGWLKANNVQLRDPHQNPPSLTNDGLSIALPRGGFDLPPKGRPLFFRDLLVTGGGQAATSES